MTPPQTKNGRVLDAIAETYGINDSKALGALSRATLPHRYSKGQRLLDQDEPQHFVIFVTDGVVRTFHTDDAGNEVTNRFIDRTGKPAVPSIGFDGPAIETVEALTDVDTLLLEVKAFKSLLATETAVARGYQRMLEEAWRCQWNTTMALRQKSARKRYLWFLDEYPGLIDRISHRHIASFLAMAPETLARVRKGLAR